MPAVTIGGRRGAALDLVSPLLIAAGCCGRGALQQREWLHGVGALVTHTLTPEPRGRGAFPQVEEAAAGLLYSTGLPNRGFDRELADGAGRWAVLPLPVIVSLAASDPRTLAGMVAELDAADCAGAIELPLGPAAAAAAAARLVAAAAAVTALPVIAKLAPVPDPHATAMAALAAGADAVCVAHGWPAAGTGAAGDEALLAGPAIMPLTLRLVTELAAGGLAPLIGCGGVASSRSALAYLAAGACAVQVGSALFRDPALASRIAAELLDVGAGGGLDPSRSGALA